jgi:hypothetical protein
MTHTGKITLGYVEFDVTYNIEEHEEDTQNIYNIDGANSSDFFINLESIEFKETNFYEVLYDQIEDIETKIKEQINNRKND